VYSQTVILMLFWGFSNKEVVLVLNKEGTRKTETGEFVKRSGWGGPAGKVEEGETLLEAAIRELEEEARLKKEQVEIYPEPIAQIRKGNHIKKLLVGRVLDTGTSLNMEETEEISKCRRFSLKSLPGGKAGIYEDHLELFLQARKKLIAGGEDMPIVAVDEKASGRVQPKDRSERRWGRPAFGKGGPSPRRSGFGHAGGQRGWGNCEDRSDRPSQIQRNREEGAEKRYTYREE